MELVLIPKSIAVAQPLKLIDEDFAECRPQTSAGRVTFGEPADPKIDVADRPIQILERLLKLFIGSDVRKLPDLRQAIRLTRGIVICQAMIAAALDVQRD